MADYKLPLQKVVSQLVNTTYLQQLFHLFKSLKTPSCDFPEVPKDRESRKKQPSTWPTKTQSFLSKPPPCRLHSAEGDTGDGESERIIIETKDREEETLLIVSHDIRRHLMQKHN